MMPVAAYPTLFGDVELEIVSVALDGDDLPYSRISKTERTVALHLANRADWQSATLRLKAVLPEHELKDGPWAEVDCVSILTEKATNVRSTVRLSRGADASWHGSIEMLRANHLHRGVLGVGVVATVGDVAGRLIGSSRQDWFIDLASARPVRQRSVEIVEADFVNGSEEWLRPFKDAPWIVDTTTEPPTVYLNTQGIEGLLDILNGARTLTAAERVVRDTTASLIAQDAWIAMFHTALTDLDLDEDGTPLMPAGWRGAVLRMMLPDVLPGRQLGDALYEARDRRLTGFGWAGLQTSIHHAAARRSQVGRKVTSAVRLALRGDEGSRG